MSDKDSRKPIPTIEELKAEIEEFKQEMAILSGNVDLIGRGKHRLTEFYYRLLERIRRLEKKNDLDSPEGSEPLKNDEDV